MLFFAKAKTKVNHFSQFSQIIIMEATFLPIMCHCVDVTHQHSEQNSTLREDNLPQNPTHFVLITIMWMYSQRIHRMSSPIFKPKNTQNK